jgi:hypothetical protein
MSVGVGKKFFVFFDKLQKISNYHSHKTFTEKSCEGVTRPAGGQKIDEA